VTQALALQVALSVSTLSMSHAASSSFIVTMTELGGLNVQTSLMLGGLPAGVTPSLSNVNLRRLETKAERLRSPGVRPQRPERRY